MKHGGYPEDALVVWASRRVGGRPVKWVSTRSEALLGDSQGRDQVVTGELALDERGKVLGMRVNALHAMGSHVFGASMVVPLFAMRLAPGVYQIPAVHAVGKAVLTNTIPLAPYRGAGRPEATYLIEQLLDRAAQRDRHRSDRDQAAQFHSVVRHAAQDPHRHHLRQRRFRPRHGRVPESSPTGTALPSAPPNRRRTASCAAAASAISSKRPPCSTTAWCCASIRAACSPSSPAPIRTARAIRPSMRRW